MKQCAVGVSFDFEKLVTIINDKSKLTKRVYRPELVICSINGNQNIQQTATSNNFSSISNLVNEGKKINKNQTESNSHFHQDIRNRLRLFKQFSMINKNMNVTTSIAHEKFTVN